MRVMIDGNVVPGALVDAEIPTDPGEHSIEVSAPGFLKSGTHVRVGDAEKKTVTLTLTRDPAAATAPTAPATTPAAARPAAAKLQQPTQDERASTGATRPAPSPRSPNHAAAYVALSLGTVGLATGGVLGILAMKRHQSLEQACPGNVCPPEKQQALTSAKQLGNFSNIAFGVGATGIALGTVLLFTVGGGESERASAQAPRFAGISRPAVAVGPGQVELSGAF
jgi:hypothetical protein